MAWSAPKPCTRCGALSDESRCPEHRTSRRPRPSASERGYDGRWRETRRAYLQANTRCALQISSGCRGVADCVDHIRPIAAGGDRLDWGNLQALCSPCHSRKTASVDGGFGNPRRAYAAR